MNGFGKITVFVLGIGCYSYPAIAETPNAAAAGCKAWAMSNARVGVDFSPNRPTHRRSGGAAITTPVRAQSLYDNCMKATGQP